MAVAGCQLSKVTENMSCAPGVKLHEQKQKIKQRFAIAKKLGQGTYGKVQLAINKSTGESVAIKTIKKQKIETKKDLIRIRREIQIMSSIRHPHIIRIYEVFENREKIIIVMEHAAGGELFEYLSARSRLSDADARKVFRQIATACYHCHKHNICHRDLKLENILLDDSGNAKIADFGLSNLFGEDRSLSTFCGSPLYASPEIVRGQPYRGPEVDCWSLGVLLYTLVYGVMPFAAGTFSALVRQITAGDYHRPAQRSLATDLIDSLLELDPQRRLTIEEVCAHRWLNRNTTTNCLEAAQYLTERDPVHMESLSSLLRENSADVQQSPSLQIDFEVSQLPVRVKENKICKELHNPHRRHTKTVCDTQNDQDMTFWIGSCRPKTFHATSDNNTPISEAITEENNKITGTPGRCDSYSDQRSTKTRKSLLFGRERSYNFHNNHDVVEEKFYRELPEPFMFSSEADQHEKEPSLHKCGIRQSVNQMKSRELSHVSSQCDLGPCVDQHTSTKAYDSLEEVTPSLHLSSIADSENYCDINNFNYFMNDRGIQSHEYSSENLSQAVTSKLEESHTQNQSPLQQVITERQERSTRSYGAEQKNDNSVVERSKTYPSSILISVTAPMLLQNNDIYHSNESSSAGSSLQTTVTNVHTSCTAYEPHTDVDTSQTAPMDSENDRIQSGTWSRTRRNSHTYRMAAQWENILNTEPFKPITLERPKRKLRDSLSIQTKAVAVPEALKQPTTTVGSIRVTQARKMFEKSTKDNQTQSAPCTIRKKSIILQDAGGLIPIKDDAGRIHLYNNDTVTRVGNNELHRNGTIKAVATTKVDEAGQMDNAKQTATTGEAKADPIYSGNSNINKTKSRKSSRRQAAIDQKRTIQNSCTKFDSNNQTAGEVAPFDEENSPDNLVMQAAYSALRARCNDGEIYGHQPIPEASHERGALDESLQTLKKSPRTLIMTVSPNVQRANTEKINDQLVRKPTQTPDKLESSSAFAEKSAQVTAPANHYPGNGQPATNETDNCDQTTAPTNGKYSVTSSREAVRVRSYRSTPQTAVTTMCDTQQTPHLNEQQHPVEESRTGARRASYARDFISRFLDRSGKGTAKHTDGSTPVLLNYTRSKTDEVRLASPTPPTPTLPVPPTAAAAADNGGLNVSANRPERSSSSCFSSRSRDQLAEPIPQLQQVDYSDSETDNYSRAMQLSASCQTRRGSTTEQPDRAIQRPPPSTRQPNGNKQTGCQSNGTIEHNSYSTTVQDYANSTLIPPANDRERACSAAAEYANWKPNNLDEDEADISETSSVGTVSARFTGLDSEQVNDRIIRKSYMPRFNVHRRVRQPSLSRSLLYLYEDPVVETFTHHAGQVHAVTAVGGQARALRPYGGGGGSLQRRASSVTADLSHVHAASLRRRSSRESVAYSRGCSQLLPPLASNGTTARRHTCYHLPLGAELSDSLSPPPPPLTAAAATPTTTTANANNSRSCRLSKISENVLKNLEMAATAIQHVRRRRQQSIDEHL